MKSLGICHQIGIIIIIIIIILSCSRYHKKIGSQVLG
jgi:hypothetical protein